MTSKHLLRRYLDPQSIPKTPNLGRYSPGCLGKEPPEKHVSNEKNPGWLGYIGDYSTQLRIPINQPV